MLADESERLKLWAVPFCQRRHHTELRIRDEIAGPLMTPSEKHSQYHLGYREPNLLQLDAWS
jgi:hypothetical protein